MNYISPCTDLLGWIIERATGSRFVDLFGELLWRPMGAVHHAYNTVDRLGAPRSAGGLCMSAMDLARVGQLIVENGCRNEVGIVPERWLNDIFQYIFSFMTNFEPVRWRWTHTLHHSYTLHTKEPHDFEIQVDRPSKLFKYFVSFIHLGPLLRIHQSYLAETFKNSLGIMTPVIK